MFIEHQNNQISGSVGAECTRVTPRSSGAQGQFRTRAINIWPLCRPTPVVEPFESHFKSLRPSRVEGLNERKW